MTTPGLSIQERFDLYVSPEPNTGCHLWDGTVARDGYGGLRINNKTVKAHRLSYELSKGPMPPNLCACHICDVRICVNPDHIFLGTRADNLREMFRKDRGYRKLTDSVRAAIVKDQRLSGGGG